MAEEDPLAEPARGGGFVYEPVASREVVTPERFGEEHRSLYATAFDFSRKEIEPRAEEIDHKKPGVMTGLMAQAAELGLFMVDIPEEYDGLGADKVTSMLVSEAVARNGSFAVTAGAHTGIGTLPLVYYGTHEQKQRYLPRLASGQWLAAYSLSEQGSGSDALAARTTATLNEGGTHYVLSGTKAWVTNAGWADLFTVFAQVDGDKFTAFLVERTLPGVSIGAEEKKLGIRGSSTCQLLLDDVEVPVDNVLGEIGRGHKIAFNILNIGRWKLGIASLGAAKCSLADGVSYAQERRQFHKPIASFGLIREKLANAAVAIYAGESMAYRLAGLLDEHTGALNKQADDYAAASAKVIEEFTIEASILKVFGSDALYYIADEMLQIHGGNGFTEDYPAERVLRDARINRIFEGTNEINRLIVPATLLKRALQGRLPLMAFTQQVIGEMKTPEALPPRPDGPLGEDLRATELCKRALVYATSYAAQKYLADLKEKQRFLGALADCAIDLFGMDSACARAQQALRDDISDAGETHVALCRLFCFEARARIFQQLRRVAMMMCDGDELDKLYDNLGKLDQRYRVDYMGMQDGVAARCLAANGYLIK